MIRDTGVKLVSLSFCPDISSNKAKGGKWMEKIVEAVEEVRICIELLLRY